MIVRLQPARVSFFLGSAVTTVVSPRAGLSMGRILFCRLGRAEPCMIVVVLRYPGRTLTAWLTCPPAYAWLRPETHASRLGAVDNMAPGRPRLGKHHAHP